MGGSLLFEDIGLFTFPCGIWFGGGQKEESSSVQEITKAFCSNTDNCDLLVTNHVLGICSCLGLLPSWVRGEIEVSATSRYMKWFLNRFNLPSGPDTMEQITETIKHALGSCYGVPFSRRKVENVLCKVYRNRTDSTSDKRFCDLVFPGQSIYSCDGDGLRVSIPNESEQEDTFIEDYLVTKWAFANTSITVEEMNGKLGMSDKGVPTPKEAENWSVPDDLMYGRARTEIELDIGHKVKVTCATLFKSTFRKVSSKLRGSH